MSSTANQMSKSARQRNSKHTAFHLAKTILESKCRHSQHRRMMIAEFDSACQITVPRFLFRGFRSSSGGGKDPRLNTELGVIPHAFLGGKRPTSIFDIPTLPAMIEAHLSMGDLETEFSSWTASFEVALGFTWDDDSGRIAILDTTQLAENVKVYYSVDLQHTGLTPFSYNDEYLIYGPVTGPGFHCVPATSIYDKGFGDISDSANPNIYDPVLTADDLANARRVAELFQPTTRHQPDIVVFMTAVMLSIRLWWSRIDQGLRVTPRDAELFTSSVADVLQPLSFSFLAWDILVNPEMSTSAGGGLQEMKYLLLAAENQIRKHGSR
ncbi:hypothetical protein AB5N19_05172 [Seiridium cardinale]